MADDYLGLGVSPAYAAYMQQAIARGDPGSNVYQWHAPDAIAYEHWAENGDNTPVSADWGAPDVAFNPQWLQSLGFAGNAITPGRFSDSGETPDAMSPELQQFIADKGLQLRLRQLPGANAGQAQYFDAAGSPVGMTVTNNLDPDKQFSIGSKLAMAIMTGGAAAAGFGSMGGTIGSSLGAGGGTFGSAVGNGLINAGMGAVTGQSPNLASTAASLGSAYLGQQGGGLGNSFTSGGGSIEPGFFAPGGPGDEGMFDFFGGGGGLGDFSFGGGDLGYTLDPNYMPTNAVDFGGMNIYTGGDMSGSGLDIGSLGIDGLWNTFDPSIVGWDVSPGGNSGGLLSGAWNAARGFLGDKGNAQMLGGLLGALAGASGSGNKQQQTTQQRMDPRMEPFVYGQGGLLSGAADWFNRNRGGNPLMNEGAQMQADFYRSPAYTQGFGQLRDRGLSLLGSQIAGNPFMQGAAAPTPQPPQFAPQPMPQPIPTQQPPGGRMTIMPVRGNYY